jgi:hypothetical protein
LARNAVRIKLFDGTSRAFKCRPALAMASLLRLGRAVPRGFRLGLYLVDPRLQRIGMLADLLRAQVLRPAIPSSSAVNT